MPVEFKVAIMSACKDIVVMPCIHVEYHPCGIDIILCEKFEEAGCGIFVVSDCRRRILFGSVIYCRTVFYICYRVAECI